MWCFIFLIFISSMLNSQQYKFNIDCINGFDKGASYRGSVNVAGTGIDCIAWLTGPSQTLSHLDSNFCRNPDRENSTWCYTKSSPKEWRYCHIPYCAFMCPDLKLNPHTTQPTDLVNYKINAVASFQCESGYKLVGSKLSTCENISGRQKMGSWSHDPPVCQAITCNPLTVKEFVLVTPTSEKYYFNEVLTLSCKRGYSGSPTTIKCNPNGSWPPLNNICTPRTCRLLRVDDKVIRSENSSKYNDNVTLSCKEGYNGEPLILKCYANGVWPSQRPNCTAVPCPALSNTKHMNQLIYHSGYHYGDTITFQCVNGYMLSGPPFITCRSNKNQLMGYWSDQQPLCSVVTCHALRQVPHQKLEPVQMKYSYRDNVTIKCNDGYELSPANTMVTCQSDGTWNKKQPNCAENSQFHKDSMENRGKCISYGFYGGSLAAIVSISTGVHVATCFYYRKRVGKPAAVYEDMQFNTVARQRSNNEETYSELT